MANWWDKYSAPAAAEPSASRNWWDKYAVADDAPDFGDVNSGVSSSAPDPNASFLDSAWRANKAQMGPIFAGNVKRMAAEVSDPIAGLLNGTFGKPAAEDAPELSLTVNPNGNTSLPASPLIAPDAGMALMDAARGEPLRNATLRDLQQSGLAQARAGGAELQQARTDMEVPESGLERYAKLAAISAGPTLAGMTAGIVTKSPAVGAGVSTLFAVPSAYGEARDAGHSVEDAIKYAGVVGGAEVVSERLGFDALLGKLATRLPAGKLATVFGTLEKSIPGRALTGAGVEGTTEALSQAAQNAYKIAGLGEHMTFDEFMTDMKDSFGAGAMIGGPLAGGHAAAQSLAAQSDSGSEEERIRRSADQIIARAERIQTPESEAVDAGRNAAAAIFGDAGISNDTGQPIPDPRIIDFTQAVDPETGLPPIGVQPEVMGDLDAMVPSEPEAAPDPVRPAVEPVAQPAQETQGKSIPGLSEPIRSGTRVFYPGDVDAMRAKLDAAGLDAGMRRNNEDGTPAGLYFPARMQAEVDAVLRRKPSEDSVEAPTNNATPERIAEVPIASLTLSDDVPQFKSGAREDGVVEPLGGKFDRRGTGPIQVWRRNDGRMEVISGRHRLDLARRSGETTIPAQVYDEAQGFDARQAASLDAELNIRDGQGKVKDYVQYFTQPAFDGPEGRQAADARGLLARATGKRAYSIASQGSSELIAAHSADRVTDEAAVQIAQAAPQNAPLQALGMKLVQEGKSIGIAANTMRAVRSMQGDRPQTSGDMFGFDDSAIQDAVKIAGVASRRQREIGERLAAITGAAKRPDIARREGVDVRDPQALPARIAQLRAEKAEWDDWATDPAKVDEIRAELGMEPQPEFARAEDPAEFVDDVTAPMFSRGLRPRSEMESAPVGAWIDGGNVPGIGPTAFQVRDVPLDKISPVELDSVGDVGPEKRSDVGRYTEAMRRGEQFPNARGYELENGKIKLVDGHRRLLAAKAAGKTSLRIAVNPLDDSARSAMFSRRTGGASGDMFGGATIEDTNRASPRSRMPETADLFGGPSMQERVGAAERARDAARNSGDGKRADTGDGGLFDGPRPEQAILRSQRKQEDEDQRPDKPTDEGIESNEITGDDADALIADMRARQQSKLDEAADPLTEGFKILGANPETFRTKLLPGKTVRELAKQSGANYAGQSNEDGIAVHSVAVEQGDAGPAMAKIYDDGNDVWIDVSGLKSGGGKGDSVYNMAYSYARNNGRNFKEDPAGVSDTAMYRRPVQQLSALLKSGDADNIAPGDFLATQRPGGPNTRPIKAPANRAFDPTLRENILTTYTNALNAVPEIGEIRYDTNRAAFVDASGKPVTDAEFDRLASNRRANPIREAMVRVGDPETGQRLEPAPVGGNSLKVAVLAQTLLGASPSQRPALLDGLRKIAAGSLGDSGLSRILPSKRTPDPQTETPAFKKWFGDSKVVDAQGKPLLVYHGAPDARFMGADATFMSIKDRYGEQRGVGAFWFARDQSTARSYADDRRAFDFQNAEPATIAAYLKLENPLVVDGGGKEWREAQAIGKTTDVIEKAQADGHDGVIIRNVKDDYNNSARTKPTDTYVVFNSTQIKSATGNSGAFDPINPSILKSQSSAEPTRRELSRTELDDDVRRVFGTSKPLTRLINSGVVTPITKAEAIKRGLGTEESMRGVKGLHDGTKGYLITDELQPNEVAGVLIHEIGVHHSMERILGAERFDKLQKAMESFRARGDKDVLAAYAAVPKDTPAHHVNHEAIAYLAEHSANHSITQKLVDATKLFLNRLGVPMSWIKAEPAAVRSIARESLLAESRRGNGSVRYNGRDTLYQKVWHGTPHRDIEKTGFSLQKIGTGEGAQAYGWGMYFAGKREVAEFYRTALARTPKASEEVRDAFILAYPGGEAVIDRIHYPRADGLMRAYHDGYVAREDLPTNLADAFDRAERAGQLYHAEIPEDSDLLDWDKPLSEQPEKVKAALAPLIEQVRDTKRFSDDPTGERIYNALSVRLAEGEAPGKLGRGAKAASEALLRAGIPGLRYLDGNSRADGKGSANYVIWDETLLTPEKAQITPYYSKRTDDEDQTQTAAFKRWFAGSKVVDSEGKPLVVYHGASTVFDVFDASRAGENTGAANTAAGFFFTNDEVQADSYVGVRGRRVDAFIRIENPLHLTGLEYDRDASGALNDAIAEHVGKPQSQVDQDDATEYVAYLKRRGFDGIEVEIPDGTYTPLFNWIVFDPTQIKSATGNNGQFDPGNPDIRFSRRKSDADLMARQQAAESGMQLYQPARTDQTQTTEFKRWFAGSKVVDSEGKPLVVYHGTQTPGFDVFDDARTPTDRDRGGDFAGIYFTPDKALAGAYAGAIYPIFLRISRPLRLPNAQFPGLSAGHIYRWEAEKIQRAGYDGVIDETGREFVAFRPEQIKSATGNRGTFDPGNPNILKSRRTPADAERDAAAKRAVAVNTLGGPTTGGAIGWNFDTGKWDGKAGTMRRARAALDDKMIAWRDVQDSIAEHLGNTVPDAQNVYRLENLMHGRVKEGIDALEEKQVVPLVKAMQEAKITPAMLEEYLYALHAKERNAQIAKINPKMPDGGSGMTNAEADAILAKPLPNGMKSIAKRAQNLVRQTRKRLLDHGIITQDQFDAMESQYQNYVPLRGKTVGENEFDSGGSGAGRGIDGRPSPVKQAFGRGAGNRAENILGEIIGDAQRSIIAAEKARVGRAVMRIVLANPNPKLWTVEPVLTERKLDSTGEVYEAVVQDWSDPSIVAVRHRGQIYKVQINHAPLAKALNLVGVDQIGAVTRAAGALNRYFSAVLTRYNPAFIPVNAARDALFGLTGLAVEHGEVTAMKAALYYPKAIRAAWREARRLPPKSQADTYAREFSEDGGKTGYVSMPSVEELQRKIGSGRFGGYSPQGIGRAAQAVGDLVGAMNDSVENALRLSAYVTLREQGMAREKAASYAKELTVNFNRKGSEGTKLNSWFLFYNASMQGIKRTGALMKSPKTWGYLGALTAAQIAAVMYAMGQEDDDGTPIWDKVPDHVKQRNLVFTWLDDGGEQKILTIPMPYGLNVFPYFAGRVADGMMHAENRPRDRAMSIAADTVSTAVQSFSPVPLDDGAMGLLPTALRIPLSIQVNRDDFGRQIRKENPFGKFDVPRASIGKPDTLEMFKVMATGLNRIGGGDERTPPPMSAFDVAPEDIEYVLEKLGGGTGKFIIDMATVGQKSTGELPVEARDIPIAKRFFTNVNEPAAQQAMFYERREAIERDADMVRDVYEKDGPEAAIALLRSTPSLSGADFRRYKESDPKKGHRKGGIVVVDGRPQLVVRRPDSVYGRYKAAAEETAEVNGAMRNAYADSPMSLRPSGERDKRLKELADKRMAAQRIFNAAWNRDVVGGE